MNITKMLLIGSVALTGALLAPSAQARDHHRNDGDRREFRYHHHDGDYARPYYYDRRRVINYDQAYYDGPSSGITIALGGHRRHWHHR